MTKVKRRILLAICIFVLIFGVCIMLYPAFSVWYNEQVRSEIFTEYQEQINELSTDEIDKERVAAQEFNHLLFSGKIDHLDPENNGYFEQLDISKNKVMAYVSIPKINVFLPVYHGTSDAVLKKGAGHMPQSSLPVGGTNTHAVITAHSGMASDPMFTDLNILESGDIFQINVLGEILTYKVFAIETVLPEQLDGLRITRDQDWATLITCTPFGVNTHRLLVHGTRIPTPETPEPTETTPAVTVPPEGDGADSVWMNKYIQNLMIGLAIAIVIIVSSGAVYIIWKKIKKKSADKHD